MLTVEYAVFAFMRKLATQYKGGRPSVIESFHGVADLRLCEVGTTHQSSSMCKGAKGP
jgi:hypothetical protein